MATTRLHKPSLSLFIPNLGPKTNLAPNPVLLLNCAPPANNGASQIHGSHGTNANLRDIPYRDKAPFQSAVPAKRPTVVLSQYFDTPAGPTKRTKYANPKTFPQQLPSRVPIPHTTTSEVRGINILNLSSYSLYFCSNGLDVTASETTALKYERIRTCRFTSATYQPKGPEPPQLTSLCAHSTRETPPPFSTAQRDTANTPPTFSSSIRITRIRATKQATTLISHGPRVTASAERE